MSLVIDASVAFKWYVREPDSDRALAIQETDQQLIAPDKVLGETSNSAWKSHRRGELTSEQCKNIPLQLLGAFDRFVSHVELIMRATELAVELDHPTYDCLYLALAEQESTVVVTADRRLIRKLKNTAHEALVRDLATFA